MNTITIGNKPVPRTVAGALNRLELLVCTDAEGRADVEFLRARLNERYELVEALRPFAKFQCSPAGECECNNCRAASVLRADEAR